MNSELVVPNKEKGYKGMGVHSAVNSHMPHLTFHLIYKILVVYGKWDWNTICQYCTFPLIKLPTSLMQQPINEYYVPRYMVDCG